MFSDLNNFYVKIINGTCRDINHSGPNGYPSKKDKCARVEKILDTKKMEELKAQAAIDKTKNKRVTNKYKSVIKCIRRKPQPKRKQACIKTDPYNKSLKQFSTASNDGFLTEVVHLQFI